MSYIGASILLPIVLFIVRLAMTPGMLGGIFKARAIKEQADGIWAGHAKENGDKLTYHWGPGDD